MGRLDVRIVEARNLPKMELLGGGADPYVKVELENQQHKTSVASSTLNPKWDEVFKLIVADPDSAQLELKLFNKNLVSDDFMGQYRMSIAGLTKGVVKDVWCLLQQCKSNAEIHIRLLAHDFGADPAPGQVASPQQQQVPTPPQAQVVYQQPVVQQQQPVYQQQPMMQQQQPVYQQQQPQFQQQQFQQPMYQQPMMGQPGYPMGQPQPMMGQPQMMGAMMGNMMGNMMQMQQNMMMGMQQGMMANQPPSQTYQDFQFVQFNGPVRRATYGPVGTQNDYTMQINSLIQRGQRQVHGGIHTVLGDPAPGQQKVFQVWY